MSKIKNRILDYLRYKSHFPVAGFFILFFFRIYQKMFVKFRTAAGFRATFSAGNLTFFTGQSKVKDRPPLALRLRSATHLPKISVITPVFNPRIKFLKTAISSVTRQVYQNWELCLADDGSQPVVRSELEKWGGRDTRIKVSFSGQRQGISRASNRAAAQATGDILVFLDHDDLLAPEALGEVALFFHENPATEIFYSDSDKVDIFGHYYDYEFKPDWSQELLLSYKYFGHLSAIRKGLFEKIGGFRPEFDGVQDYDLFLRATEISRAVGHLPLVLYHWRAAPGSAALSGDNKPDLLAGGRRTLEESLSRREIFGRVFQPDWAAAGGNSAFDIQFSDDGPPVTIIVIYENNLVSLERALLGLRNTTYKNFRVLLAAGPDFKERIQIPAGLDFEIMTFSVGSGMAAMKNAAAGEAAGEYLVFFSGFLLVENPGWLSQMMGYVRISGVGAVGARLMNPDGTIFHAGIVRRPVDGQPVYPFQGLFPEDDYLFYSRVTRNYSALSGECFLINKELFFEMDGYDEGNLADSWYDIDFCFRMAVRGKRCVYCASAILVQNRPAGFPSAGGASPEQMFLKKYSGRSDPYYNQNFF